MCDDSAERAPDQCAECHPEPETSWPPGVRSVVRTLFALCPRHRSHPMSDPIAPLERDGRLGTARDLTAAKTCAREPSCFFATHDGGVLPATVRGFRLHNER